MHAPFGDHFAIKVGEFLQEPDILHKLRSPRTCGHHVLVIDYWTSGVGGQLLFVTHCTLLIIIAN